MVQIHSFLTSALDGSEWSLTFHTSTVLLLLEEPLIRKWILDWVGQRALFRIHNVLVTSGFRTPGHAICDLQTTLSRLKTRLKLTRYKNKCIQEGVWEDKNLFNIKY